ncbi:hypothetical protein BCL69_10558 [Nitrosomonas communis]|uniref:Uncharacterized protein n=1 Tax=Nitrosomonas communis TaxID=44574 RepID=A0A5D3YDB3_9PROT|nr:hypothetical protein BCL69_10558 [Nitrosomonas communis]
MISTLSKGFTIVHRNNFLHRVPRRYHLVNLLVSEEWVSCLNELSRLSRLSSSAILRHALGAALRRSRHHLPISPATLNNPGGKAL